MSDGDSRSHRRAGPSQISHHLFHSLGHRGFAECQIGARVVGFLVADLSVDFQDGVVVLEAVVGDGASEGVCMSVSTFIFTTP